MKAPEVGANVEGDALRAWRRKATDLVTVASVVLHLPIVVPVLAGYGPEDGWPAKITGALAYLVIASCALFRRVDQRRRAWAILAAIYATAFVGGIAFPLGPYLRALPIIPPMLAIGLLGVRAARLCTLLSAAILMVTPFLNSVPAAARLFGAAPDQAPLPQGQAWWPGIALTVEIVVLMVLLERFYAFLLQSVVAQRQAGEERCRLESEIARAGDEERRRLGHEIHDGVCQQLTGALLRCQALEARLRRGTPLPPADLDALSSLLGETIHEARAVAQGLCPVEPAPDALAPAIYQLVRRTQRSSGVACEFRAKGNVLVADPAAAQHLYRIAQEALSNAVCHARASLVEVELDGEEDALLLRVVDDGVGLPSAVPSDGMGMRTMASRAQILEGAFAVERAPGGGTRVTCRVPRRTMAVSAPGSRAADGSPA